MLLLFGAKRIFHRVLRLPVPAPSIRLPVNLATPPGHCGHALCCCPVTRAGRCPAAWRSIPHAGSQVCRLSMQAWRPSGPAGGARGPTKPNPGWTLPSERSSLQVNFNAGALPDPKPRVTLRLKRVPRDLCHPQRKVSYVVIHQPKQNPARQAS